MPVSLSPHGQSGFSSRSSFCQPAAAQEMISVSMAHRSPVHRSWAGVKVLAFQLSGPLSAHRSGTAASLQGWCGRRGRASVCHRLNAGSGIGRRQVQPLNSGASLTGCNQALRPIAFPLLALPPSVTPLTKRAGPLNWSQESLAGWPSVRWAAGRQRVHRRAPPLGPRGCVPGPSPAQTLQPPRESGAACVRPGWWCRCAQSASGSPPAARPAVRAAAEDPSNSGSGGLISKPPAHRRAAGCRASGGLRGGPSARLIQAG